MLPEAQDSLREGGLSAKVASWTLIGAFTVGALGIQILSRFLHKHVPTHVIDCEHTHDEEAQKNQTAEDVAPGSNGGESRKCKKHDRDNHEPCSQGRIDTSHDNMTQISESTKQLRPSLQSQFSNTLSRLSFRTNNERNCNREGFCHGYTEPCGQECFKNLQMPNSTTANLRHSHKSHRHTRDTTAARDETTPLLTTQKPQQSHDRAYAVQENCRPNGIQNSSKSSKSTNEISESRTAHEHSSSSTSSDEDQDATNNQHHHHVPKNAFLSIGLQTSIAIALHKLPEGFITYATNHANPKLGFSVFMALFIHNITEGFAMALPLYLAIRSRWKAMFWSTLLGGFSQPVGAGIAALWFKAAGNSNLAPGEGIYGAMFACTAGIMTSVALQLFSESLDRTHNRGLCMFFAFVGMAIMGASSALTA